MFAYIAEMEIYSMFSLPFSKAEIFLAATCLSCNVRPRMSTVIWVMCIQIASQQTTTSGRCGMADNARSEATKAQAPAAGMRGEIEQRWGKFSAQEITALKDKDDLVEQVQTKYSLDRAQAQRDVNAFAKGRQL
jgi:hypothetical protein